MYDSGLTSERDEEEGEEEKPVHSGTDGTIAIGSRSITYRKLLVSNTFLAHLLHT